MHDTQNIQLMLTAVAAVALLIQTIFMIVIAVMLMKAIKTGRQELNEYRTAVMPIVDKIKPIVDKVQRVVDDLAPKVEEISTQLTVMSKSLREQTADIQVAANDIIDRTRRQASRVDNIVTSVLNRVERVGDFVSDAVAKPMRQMSGLIASVKAAVETLREPETVPPRAPRAVPARYQPDGEHASGPRPTGTATPFRP